MKTQKFRPTRKLESVARYETHRTYLMRVQAKTERHAIGHSVWSGLGHVPARQVYLHPNNRPIIPFFDAAVPIFTTDEHMLVYYCNDKGFVRAESSEEQNQFLTFLFYMHTPKKKKSSRGRNESIRLIYNGAGQS